MSSGFSTGSYFFWFLVSNMKNIVFSIYKYCFETYASINDILRCVGANDSPHYKHDKTLTVFPSLFRA